MAPTGLLQEVVAPLSTSSVQEICACYFENHVSPMLKLIQNSQELMKEKLEDNHTRVQNAADALRVEQRLLKFELGEFLAKSPDNYTTVQKAADAFTTLKQMQELTAKVHQKADASDLARLTSLVESEVGLSSRRSIKGPQVSPQGKSPSEMQREDRIDAFEERLMRECMARFDKRDADLAKKADSEHVALLVQVQEMRKELLAATAVMAEHKVEGSTAWNNVEGNKAEAREEQMEPTGEGVSKPCLSNTLRSNLTNSEEDNERLLLDKDLEEPPLDSEITFLSDDSPLKSHVPLNAEDSTRDSTQQPCSSKRCTQELHCETEATLQQERVALNVERAQMQQAEQEAGRVEVCIIAQEECDRLRDKLEEAQTARRHDRSCLTERHSEELAAWQQERDPLCNEPQVEVTHVAMEAETLREAGLRAAAAEKDEALQQVEPIGADLSKRSLSKILKLKLTNAEEDNERLQQQREDLSRKLRLFREMSDTTVGI